MRSSLKTGVLAGRVVGSQTTLDAVATGTIVLIRGVAGTSDLLRDRMRAMGLCEGRRVEVLRNGPRLIVSTMGTRIGLDQRLAETVTVERVDHGSADHEALP
jgi:Fe2+ transport system protein FeoA